MSFEAAFVALFTVATAVALVARRLKVPYTVALVLTGLLLGSTHLVRAPTLTKDLLYSVFLPGLLFEAGFSLRLQRLWAEKAPTLALAIPGVVAAMVLTGALAAALGSLAMTSGFSFRYGLVFGVIVAATDPIAVVAIFRRLAVPERLSVLVEGESLLNDGTTVVLFSLVVGAVSGGGASIVGIVLSFVRIVGLATAVGAAVALVASRLIARAEDPMVEMMVTTIVAYGSFLGAEQLHSSGVVATVVAGLVCGDATARHALTADGKIAVHVGWEFIAFALNSALFLLIGFQVDLAALLASWLPVLLAFGAVFVGRAVVVALVTALLARTRQRLPWRWALVLTWGGLRGGLSMVLVLGLPVGFPYRSLLVNMTFGVVLLSIVLQGLSIGTLVRWLGIGRSLPPVRRVSEPVDAG